MGSASTLRCQGGVDLNCGSRPDRTVSRYLERVIVKPQALELCLLPPREVSVPGEETNTCGSVI
jgi:hypothetical protein